ncbi:LysR family transcriptional regulator [Marinobacterium halophilum]|uniref:LysR family transcriptional regulator n=1 Tax=Marinobacterium halophilum TaxID=267374 RepID=A0A2P8EYV2_9GAMM|nr:transcriptional regulator CynR [Marinobacterium halophilum]PSL14648.1 LysR family transcriptional regulator [Marinobacterium halophilum]
MLLRHIHYFLAVAEHRNFTRAASAMHVSQPALSQQIKQLEENLGTRLFDRSGRSIALTDAGEVYARYARRALQDLDAGKRAIHDVSDLSRGLLRIAITPTFTPYLIGPLVRTFHERHAHIRLQVEEMSQERMEERLLEDDFDLGIAFADVHSRDIESRPLLEERLALVVNRDHPLANRQQIDAQTLGTLSLVLLNTEFATREQIDRYCRQHALHPQVMMEANSVSAVIEMVRHTPLASLLPAQVAQERADLLALPLTPTELTRTAVLLLRKDAYRSAATRAFIALAGPLKRE